MFAGALGSALGVPMMEPGEVSALLELRLVAHHSLENRRAHKLALPNSYAAHRFPTILKSGCLRQNLQLILVPLRRKRFPGGLPDSSGTKESRWLHARPKVPPGYGARAAGHSDPDTWATGSPRPLILICHSFLVTLLPTQPRARTLG